MTLSEKNIVFRAGIVFCGLSTLLIAVASFLVVPVYSKMGEAARRPAVFFQGLISRFLPADYLAAHVSLIMVVLYSIIAIILIYVFFEQTPAPEIFYIAVFAISFSFEVIRLILPLKLIFDIPLFYLLIASRILIFARYFSVFSLFAASICAAGLDVQNTRNMILAVFIATLVITVGAPIDTQNWDTSLNMIRGYNSMFRLLDIVAFVSTVAGFFIAVNIRGNKEYKNIGLGVMLALIGRFLLLSADNWASPVLGILLLSFGTWLICSNLHKMHLWL